MIRDTFILATYLAASVPFILGLRSLTRPDRAQRVMHQAAVGMLLAVVGTLLSREIVRFDWIIGGLLLGTAIGYPLGMFVPMTAMPQRIAVSHMFGALAATLALTLAALLAAGPLMRLLGDKMEAMITRILGVILAALATQFVIDGLEHSFG